MRSSALLTPLLRGHVIMRQRPLHLGASSWFSSCILLSSSASDGPVAATGFAEGCWKPREWTIPWDTGEGGEVLTLTRKLEKLPNATESADKSDTFRVMSFNMLAQRLACSEYFPYVAKGQLKQRKRIPRVKEEISRYGADIICLQECDAFEEILGSVKAEGASQGALYEGVYTAGEGKGHGVAIFYDSKVFRLLDFESCDYGRALHRGVGACVLLEDLRRGHCARDQGRASTAEMSSEHESNLADERKSQLAAAMSTRNNGRAVNGGERGEASMDLRKTLCVATTHLYWHPNGESIRLAQAEVFMESMEGFLRRHVGDKFASVPVVLNGDLNTVPGVGVYRLLAGGFCQGVTPEAFQRSQKYEEGFIGAEEARPAEANVEETVREYRQSFEGLVSANGAYRSVFGSQLIGYPLPSEAYLSDSTRRRTVGCVQLGARAALVEPQANALELERAEGGNDRLEQMASSEPELTTCTSSFAAAIDYIWHSPHFNVQSLLGLPSLEQAMRGGGLPSASYPSDHVSIMAELRWRRDHERQ